jgi:hypothetical protein
VTSVVPFARWPGRCARPADGGEAVAQPGEFRRGREPARAGGIAGARAVASAAPDGHTLLLANTNLAINPSLYRSLPYDTAAAFTPLILAVTMPNVIVVRPSGLARSLAELIALAKAEPGRLNYASAGNGTFPHLAMALLLQQAGISMTHPMDEGRFGDTSRRTVMASIEESLRRLGTDWIDLYQVHRFDPLTPVEEMLRALDDLVRQGKVRYIGCSRFAAWQVVDALWTSRLHGLNAFISCQDEYSLAREPDNGLLDAVQAHGLGCCPISRSPAGC